MGRMAELHAEQDEQRQEEEYSDFLAWHEEQQVLGQPSPVNDGILKGNENGLHRI